MRNRHLIAASCGFVTLGCWLIAIATTRAEIGTFGKTAYLTFNRSVGLPGVTLDAGTYIFELANPAGASSMVRVSSANRRMIYYTGFTHPIDRPAAMSPTQLISFGEAPTNESQPIRVWWPAYEPLGYQFIDRTR